MDVKSQLITCYFRSRSHLIFFLQRKTVAPSSITDNSTNSVEAGQTRKRRNTDNNTVSSTKTPSKLTPSSKSGTAVPAPTVPQVKIATTIPPVQKIQTAEPEGVVLVRIYVFDATEIFVKDAGR